MTERPQQTPKDVAQRAGARFRLAMARDMARLHADAMPKAAAADLQRLINALESKVRGQSSRA